MVIFTLTGRSSGCVVAGTIGRSVFIFVLTATVNVTFERRGHIVVILGTDISVVNIGRRMHSVVFLTVAVNVSAAFRPHNTHTTVVNAGTPLWVSRHLLTRRNLVAPRLAGQPGFTWF